MTQGVGLTEATPTLPPTTPAGTLAGHVQEFICQQFAEFRSASEIVGLLRQEYGLDVGVERVYWYWRDPTWRKRILERRSTIETQIRELPIASKYWRLQQLEDMYRREGRLRIGNEKGPMKRAAEARETLKLAAQELGDLRAQAPDMLQVNVVHQVQLAGGGVMPPVVEQAQPQPASTDAESPEGED